MSPIVKARGLGKRYRLYDRPGDRLRELLSPTRRRLHREFWALQDLDLEVQRGECVGLVGSNGAGQSTTLKLLAGKLRPTTGAAEVHGRLSSILELGTGFQPHLTGRQNACVSALFMGLAPWEADRHVDRIIEFAELGEHADQPLSTYSSGMQARLAFAALTTVDPEVLILDEALATGDARFAQKCNDYLRALCRSGCTTIIASHDIRFLATTCDRVVWIDRGRKVGEGPAGEVARRYLDAAGAQRVDEAQRPRQVVVRLAAAPGHDDVSHRVHALHWADDAGALLSQHYVGDDATWQVLVEAAGAAGFSPRALRAPWGPSELTPEAFFVRACRPATAPERAAYVVLPLPQPPAPVPARLQVVIERAAPSPLVVSLFAEGRWVELGPAGEAAAGPPWAPTSFDVTTALSSAPAPAPARGAASC